MLGQVWFGYVTCHLVAVGTVLTNSCRIFYIMCCPQVSSVWLLIFSSAETLRERPHIHIRNPLSTINIAGTIGKFVFLHMQKAWPCLRSRIEFWSCLGRLASTLKSFAINWLLLLEYSRIVFSYLISHLIYNARPYN